MYKYISNNMATIQISLSEFRKQIATFCDRVDDGDKVIFRRGSRKAYAIVPIDDNDLYFSPEMLSKIDRSLKEADEGHIYKMKPDESLDDFLSRTKNEKV